MTIFKWATYSQSCLAWVAWSRRLMGLEDLQSLIRFRTRQWGSIHNHRGCLWINRGSIWWNHATFLRMIVLWSRCCCMCMCMCMINSTLRLVLIVSIVVYVVIFSPRAAPIITRAATSCWWLKLLCFRRVMDRSRLLKLIFGSNLLLLMMLLL